MPNFPSGFGRHQIPQVSPAIGQRHYRVGYFLSCLDDVLFPEVSRATLKVLTESGCEVVTPLDIACCGMPARVYGELELARESVKHNIKAFALNDLDAIITDCATCGSMFREYPKLIGDAPERESVEAFSRKIIDISAFLAQIGWREPKPLKKTISVTYHDPCHLGRGQKVKNEPRDILQSIPGIKLLEMTEADLCCGGAGSYNITHFEPSMKTLERKICNIQATGAEMLATGCPSCQMQFQAGFRRAESQTRVIHTVQLLAAGYVSPL